MRKRNVMGKIFGIALVFVMVGSMLGGLSGIVNSSQVEAARAPQPQKVPGLSAESDDSLGNTGDLSIPLVADQYEINQVGEYSVIEMEGFGSSISPGEPKLPSKTFLVGLPPGAEAVSVDMVASDYAEILGEYRIMPAPPIVSLQENEKVKWGENEEIYSSENAYPSSSYEYLGMGQMRKYNFARVRFCPIAYYPASNKLGLYGSITLKIKYEISQMVSPELLSDTVMDDVASEIILNYGSMKSQYQLAMAPSAVSYDYVIITTESLQGAVESLVTWKTTIGYSVNVVTTSWISSNYAGIDLPEKIRNFLIDKYAEWGIEYVLIVGSHSTIPMRYCYPDPSDHDPNSDSTTPTDYYYADLTGNWDSDGDGYFGEYEQDDVDFHPEVYVGRIPVDDSAMVNSICQKSVNFEQDGGAWKKKTLLLGAIYNYEGELYDGRSLARTDGAALMEECWNYILSDNGYSRERMYEKEGLSPSTYACDHALTNSNVLNASYGWPSGYGIVNWGAHAWPATVHRQVWAWDDGDGIPERETEMDWPVFISSSDTGSLDDSKPAIVFSCSCNTAWPEDAGSLGNSLLEQGAVAFVGATRSPRYIDGWQNADYGGCESSDYYFFHYLINYNEKCGDALYRSQVWNCDYLPWPYWCFWQNILAFCLYGDPSLGTATIATPPDISVHPANFDVTLPPDTTHDYTLTIGNTGGATLSYDISDEETTGGSSTAGGETPTFLTSRIRERDGLIELNPSQPMSFATAPASGTEIEIAYDDGEADGHYTGLGAGDGFAVRFTPSEYPVDLKVARFCFWAEWPDADHEEFAVEVYDDDGAGGAPGTQLGTTVHATAANWDWWDVDISGLGITITSGDFYILYKHLTDCPDCEGLCVDSDDPVGRSWDYYLGGEWEPWEYDNYMIRCVVEGPGCPWLDEEPKSGTVPPGGEADITLTVNTTGLTPGEDYAAEIVIGNNDPDENPKTVPVTLHVGEAGRKGDFDNDGDIDLVDFFLFAAAYDSELGDDNYNPAGDFNDDDVINLYDFFLFAAVYGT